MDSMEVCQRISIDRVELYRTITEIYPTRVPENPKKYYPSEITPLGSCASKSSQSASESRSDLTVVSYPRDESHVSRNSMGNRLRRFEESVLRGWENASRQSV